MPIQTLDASIISDKLAQLRVDTPLVHCMTNEVVQEITANVLLAIGASPAMVVGSGEVSDFAKLAGGLLINIGTPYDQRLTNMKTAVKAAGQSGTPWILDPVAAGILPWRDKIINEFLALKPTVIRGNASEIMALAGAGTGGKGVDSTESSEQALPAAISLAQLSKSIVAVTGEIDYVTNGKNIIKISGGTPMLTKVVGTGCSLSALVAAFCAGSYDYLTSTAVACSVVKKAGEKALKHAKGPGSFHNEYLDALYLLGPEDFS